MEVWQNILWIAGLVVAVLVIVDVWRSNASTGAKIGWSIFAFFCTLLTLVVWLVWGRKRAYQGAV